MCSYANKRFLSIIQKGNILSYSFESVLKFVLKWYTDKVEIDDSQTFERVMGIITVLHANVKEIIKIL